MKKIKGLINDLQNSVNELTNCVNTNSLESLIKALGIMQKIGVSYYNNEIQYQVVVFMNEQIFKNTQIKAKLQSPSNNSYDIILVNKQTDEAKTIFYLNLAKKTAYYPINMDAALCRTHELINRWEKHISDIQATIEYESNSKQAERLNGLLGTYIKDVEKEKRSLKSDEKVNEILDKEMPYIIEQLEALGFTVNYFNNKPLKEYKLFIKKIENFSYTTDAYYEESLNLFFNKVNNLIVFIGKENYGDKELVDMARGKEIEFVDLNESVMENILQYLKDSPLKFQNIRLSFNTDKKELAFEKENIKYALYANGDFNIEGEAGRLYPLAKNNVIADIISIINESFPSE